MNSYTSVPAEYIGHNSAVLHRTDIGQYQQLYVESGSKLTHSDFALSAYHAEISAFGFHGTDRYVLQSLARHL